MRAIVLTSSRTPDERAGDLDAQVGANVLGVERFAALADEPLDDVVAYGERRMRAALDAMPDGTWTFSDVVDSTGPAPDQQRPARIELRLTIAGDRATFDFTGTDEQRRGNVNAVEAVTVSAVAWALRSAVDPTIPANGGATRCVEVVAPAGTIVAARPPAAVGAGNVEVSQRVADVCLGVLAQVRARPGAGRVAGHDEQRPRGRRRLGLLRDDRRRTGRSATPSDRRRPGPRHERRPHAMTNTKNTPIGGVRAVVPDAGRALPAATGERWRRRRSGWRGHRARPADARGRHGVADHRTAGEPPWGLAGGEPGAVGENWLLPGGDEADAERLPDKCTLHLKAGDVLRMLTPGGGGWGAA